MRIECCCCGRQILKGKSSDKWVAPSPATIMWSNKWACADCSRDLDKNGLFPEEATSEITKDFLEEEL